MNSVPRKLTLGLIIAFGAVACGDDVTVSEEPPPTPVVRSVVVSPSSATVAAGASFTFGAAVDADAPLARTVTWSSSNAAVASVDANGVATAVATLTAGGVSSICAASTADANVKGCAQLTVTPAAAAATVQIDAITVDCTPLNLALPGFAGCGLQTPVQTNNVGGQITVAAIINRPAGSGVTGVTLEILGGANFATVEASFSQSLSGDFIAASEEGLAAQTNVGDRVTFQVQTHDYAVASNVATVKHTNGQKKMRVRLTGSGNITAQAENQLTFRNANGFHVTTNNPTGNNANGAAVRQTTAGGVSWIGGTGLTITAAPVNYSGVALSTTAGAFTVNFGSGCNIGSAPLVRTAAATNAAGVWSGTLAFTPGSGAALGDLDLYEMGPASACAATGELPFATALDANGDPFVSIPLGGNYGANNTLNNALTPVMPGLPTVSAFRLDNRPPQGTVVINFNPNSRANFWVNDQVVFNALQPTGGSAATSNNMISNTSTAADLGFGGMTFAAKAGTTLALAIASADITGPQGLAPSVNNTGYCLVQYARDGFGNRTASPGGSACPANQNFGLDRFAPVVTYTPASLAANARINTATIGGEFQVTMVDTGTVGNSGMAPANPFAASISRRNALATTCVFGTGSGCAEAPADGITVSATPPTAQSIITANTVVGYFTFTGTARDAAGNTTAAGSRVIAYDNTAPIVSAAAAPATVTAPGYSVSSFVSEDLDIWQQWFSVEYGAALAPNRVGQQTTVVNGFNATPLIHTNFQSTQAINLPLAVQANMAAGLTTQTLVVSNAMGQSNLVTTGAGASPTITAPTAMALTNWSTFGTPAFVNPAHTGVSTGGPTAPTLTEPATTSIAVTAAGATAIFANPFSRVDFYAVNQAGTEWRFIGSVPASAATLTDNGSNPAGRVFTYTLSINGAAVAPNVFGPAPATTATTIIAIGMNAAGSVGMLSAGTLAFQFVF